MKRLWLSVLLLAVMFSATLWNSFLLRNFAENISSLLDQAEGRAENGDWDGAKALTEEALRSWDRRDSYLHISLRHTDTDEIRVCFHEVMEFITCQEAGEYSAANARLTARLELLWEMEQFSLKNIL